MMWQSLILVIVVAVVQAAPYGKHSLREVQSLLKKSLEERGIDSLMKSEKVYGEKRERWSESKQKRVNGQSNSASFNDCGGMRDEALEALIVRVSQWRFPDGSAVTNLNISAGENVKGLISEAIFEISREIAAEKATANGFNVIKSQNCIGLLHTVFKMKELIYNNLLPKIQTQLMNTLHKKVLRTPELTADIGYQIKNLHFPILMESIFQPIHAIVEEVGQNLGAIDQNILGYIDEQMTLMDRRVSHKISRLNATLIIANVLKMVKVIANSTKQTQDFCTQDVQSLYAVLGPLQKFANLHMDPEAFKATVETTLSDVLMPYAYEDYAYYEKIKATLLDLVYQSETVMALTKPFSVLADIANVISGHNPARDEDFGGLVKEILRYQFNIELTAQESEAKVNRMLRLVHERISMSTDITFQDPLQVILKNWQGFYDLVGAVVDVAGQELQLCENKKLAILAGIIEMRKFELTMDPYSYPLNEVYQSYMELLYSNNIYLPWSLNMEMERKWNVVVQNISRVVLDKVANLLMQIEPTKESELLMMDLQFFIANYRPNNIGDLIRGLLVTIKMLAGEPDPQCRSVATALQNFQQKFSNGSGSFMDEIKMGVHADMLKAMNGTCAFTDGGYSECINGRLLLPLINETMVQLENMVINQFDLDPANELMIAGDVSSVVRRIIVENIAYTIQQKVETQEYLFSVLPYM